MDETGPFKPTTFEVAVASLAGTKHRRAFENNQDAVHVHGTSAAVKDRRYRLGRDDLFIAVVADGCSEGEHSEVGAKLGARLLVEALRTQADAWLRADPSEDARPFPRWEAVRQSLLDRLAALLPCLGGTPDEALKHHFLFTLVGVLLTRRGAEFFAIGDGVIAVNGDICRIESIKQDEPDYLGYALVPSSIPPERLRFATKRHLPIEELQSFLVGTDGVEYILDGGNMPIPGGNGLDVVGPLGRLWEDDRFFRTSPAGVPIPNLERHLVLLNGGTMATGDRGLLKDDTTLVVGRRREACDGDE